MLFTFARVPLNVEIREKWIEAVKSCNYGVYNGLGFICVLHFEEAAFTRSNNGQFGLKCDAVPTVFAAEAISQNENNGQTNGEKANDSMNDWLSDCDESNSNPVDFLSIETRLSFEMKIQVLSERLTMSKQKFKELLNQTTSLQKQASSVEKTINALRSENERLRKQLKTESTTKVPDVSSFLIFACLPRYVEQNLFLFFFYRKLKEENLLIVLPMELKAALSIPRNFENFVSIYTIKVRALMNL